MKTIYLVRHAKSDRAIPGIEDIDRPLAERGYQDALLSGKVLSGKVKCPDLIMCSPSVRTYSTALILAKCFRYDLEKIRINPRLYETGPAMYLRSIHSLDDELNSVMIVGHNPSISETAVDLAKNGAFGDLPTCAILALEQELKHWKSFGNPEPATQKLYLFPRMLKEE
jgi:phosphohistidine phosphatase